MRLLRQYTPDLAADHDAIVEELKRIFLAGFSASAPDVPVDSTVTDLAADWALEHATDVEALLSETTQNEVRELVAAAVKDGLSPQQLTAALYDTGAFSASRAEQIAITESATALGQGQRAAAVVMGQDEKQWIPGQCEYCLANAGDGWIGIDETFSTGDDTVPAHPRCTCTVIYRTKRVHEDEEDDEEEKALRDAEEKDPRVVLVAQARCPQCRRLMGRSVNVGAELWCARCRQPTVVQSK